jgi:hypothetical protein
MRTPLRRMTKLRTRHDGRSKGQAADLAEVLVAVGIPHDRYTIAIHLDSHQIWVIDTADSNRPRGPYLSSRQAWAIANDLKATNLTTTTTTKNGVARC